MSGPGAFPWPSGKFTGYTDNQRRYIRIGWNGALTNAPTRPADATPDEWAAAVRKVFTTARGDAFLESIPSHWLEAMRAVLVDVGRP